MNIEAALEKYGSFIVTTAGVSMLPLIRSRRDTVLLEKSDRKLRKYDIVLYRRASGHCVLHRIIKIKNQSYVLCGDHQLVREHGVSDSQIIGVARGIYRTDRYIDCKRNIFYKTYVFVWCSSFILRGIILTVVNIIARIKKYINFNTRENP